MLLLHVQQARLAFGHVPLFEDADLRVDDGERIALIGRNGSGKSSLLAAIAGEIPLDGGTIWRQPGLRVARLAQTVLAQLPFEARRGAEQAPEAVDRTVHDEIAQGLVPFADGHSEDLWQAEQKIRVVLSRLQLDPARRLSEPGAGA